MGKGSSLPRVHYTKEVPNSAREGSTPIYRHLRAKDNLDSEMVSYAKTLHESFVITSEKYGGDNFLGTRECYGDTLGEYT